MKTHFITNLIYTAALICLVYFIAIAILTRMNSFFHVIWLVFSVFLFMLGKVVFLSGTGVIRVPSYLTVSGALLSGAILILLVIVEGIIIKNAATVPDPGAKYVVVLGAQVKGKLPSLALLNRLEAAKEYLDENPETKAIVSGARGYGEDITEAQCMYNWLTENGIDPDRIIKEEKSVNTDENIRFSRDYMENPSDYIVLITNSFHTFRAKGAYTTWYMLPTYYLREAMAVVKYKLMGQI